MSDDKDDDDRHDDDRHDDDDDDDRDDDDNTLDLTRTWLTFLCTHTRSNRMGPARELWLRLATNVMS